MTHFRRRAARAIQAALLASLFGAAHTGAQTPPAAAASAPSTAAAPTAPAPAPAAAPATPATPVAPAATLPAAAASAPAPSAPSPLVPTLDPAQCASYTDRASAADMQAATVQSQRGDIKQLAALLDQAIGDWTQAIATCDGRARERARRNLTDTQKLRRSVTEMQGSGEHCDSTQKNATSLQELARQAISERRWVDAALLFRKSEGQWELATERCTGGQRQIASQRREQAEIDGHNAEFCAPQFDRAREFTQRFRSSAAAMAPADKQRQSQQAETLWRDALTQCRGSAQELARNNAENLARERGTPWVPNRPSAPTAVATQSPAPVGAAPAAVAVAAAAAGTAATAGRSAAPLAAAPAAANVAPAAGSNVSATVTAALAAATGQSAVAAKPVNVTLPDGTRFSGLLGWDEASRSYSGTGQIQWPNGDAYEGDLVRGIRHGKGEFRWPNGQSYKGDWVENQPQGQGSMRFANGNLFEGSIVAGVPEGAGSMVYANGEIYRGTMRAGQPDGKGVYSWTNGQRCDCTWVAGQATGPGSLRFANGNLYEGGLQDGQPQGAGVLKYASGERYEGLFDKGQFEGLGSYTWKNGDQFKGQWKAGVKEGPGTMTWANGDRWEGVYKADAQAEGVLKRK